MQNSSRRCPPPEASTAILQGPYAPRRGTIAHVGWRIDEGARESVQRRAHRLQNDRVTSNCRSICPYNDTINMRFRNLVSTLALMALVAPASAAQQPLRIDLNIPTSRLIVYEGDRAIRSYPVSVGKATHGTPVGEFSITHAEWNPSWRPPQSEWARGKEYTPPGLNNPMGRVKLFFMPLYFIHGTPDRESIGTPASHGCVRMLNADVVALSRLIHERAAPHVSKSDIDRILASPTQTRRVNLREEIPVVIRYEPVVVDDGEILVYPDVYRRNAIHVEGVYQALMAAGYDVAALDMREVRAFVDRVRNRRDLYRVPVTEAFGSMLAMAPSAVAAR
jgi:lipoprotein-anchoring transpeptidase ErfK/SrfK